MTKKYQINHPKEHKKQQHCPTCNSYVKYNDRYTDYVCAKCVLLAVDKQGQAIAFHNITESGHGIQGVYTESEKLYRSTTCFIKGIKCKAEEAYLGGIVIRPFKRDRNSKEDHSSTEVCETRESLH